MTAAEKYAAKMGARAGQRFRATGIPARCPLPAAGATAAAAAQWRRAYLAALAGPQ